MPRKKGKSPDLDGEIIANIPVSNSFELLKNAPEVEITSKKDKIPPIVLNGRPANIRQFLEDTRKVVKDKFRITNRGRTTQILTSNVEDFEALKGLFRLRELEFHTFALRSEHMKRFVIHGLAEGFSAEEVEEELKATLPAVVRVVQMEKREGGKKRKIPVFIVTTKQEVTINDLKGVGDISLHTFRVEKYRSGDTPPQCFRCQRYGHTSRYCNLKEVCVKCSGNHHTKDCKEGAQVKCANCQKAHVASYRQCETRIAFLEKRSSAPIGQRTPAGPVTQRRQWSAARPVATTYSFSQALGNQQGSDQMGSNIGTRQTGTNTASIKNVISEMKLLDRDIKELNILPMLNLLKQMMTEIRNSQDSVGRLEILIKGTVIAAGDFNARHRLWGCQKKNKSGGVLYDFVMDRRAALVAPSNPTCVPCNGGTPSTLDLVLTNSHKCITDMRTVTEGGSDHLPVLFNIWGRAEANVKRPIYNFAQTDWDLFRRSLDLNIPTASPPLDTPSRIEAAVESLTREINEAIRISTPTKSQLPPRVELPREIVELIKLKNAVRRRWQSQRREEDKKMMNQLQRAVRDKIAEWKTERWNKMLRNTTTRDNTFWNLLRRFNRQCGRTNPTLRDGSEVASTNPEKATLLAKYFSGVNNQSTTRGNRSFVEQVDAQVRRILTAPPEVSPTDTITETPTAKLYKHTTPVEIREVLTKLKTNKAPGSDGITNKVAKNISRKALTKLTNIINAILRTCHYPRQWKTATVVALPKPGKLPSLPSSYRPISLLSVLAKITDKIILSRLLRVTEALDIIPDSQFGFRRKHATTHQLSRVVSHVSEQMKSGRSTAMVSLDCEKAYDTVWTNGLLFRLTEYNFPLPLIKIMQSYLSDRNIRVRIGESLSEEVSLQAGLPQGSVLSPWLFNIYTAHVLRSTTTPGTAQLAATGPLHATRAHNNMTARCIPRHLMTTGVAVAESPALAPHVAFWTWRMVPRGRMVVMGPPDPANLSGAAHRTIIEKSPTDRIYQRGRVRAILVPVFGVMSRAAWDPTRANLELGDLLLLEIRSDGDSSIVVGWAVPAIGWIRRAHYYHSTTWYHSSRPEPHVGCECRGLRHRHASSRQVPGTTACCHVVMRSSCVQKPLARTQSVEHETLNLRVVGSSPTLGANIFPRRSSPTCGYATRARNNNPARCNPRHLMTTGVWVAESPALAPHVGFRTRRVPPGRMVVMGPPDPEVVRAA
ncbi:hypothetical protein AAG570_006072 [Ranatra chinensis]|uniref:Reverse transcriptase domain-containing protein n=1 Tax=Ranatra chinensis TaxID=642074 RepID=A0ABD0XY09_9HEMI